MASGNKRAATIKEHYYGLYARALDVNKDESGTLSSRECIVGSRMQVKIISAADLEDADEEAQATLGLVELRTQSGKPVGRLDRDVSTSIIRRIDAGMNCAAFLSAVLFREADGWFCGEFALVCFDAQQEAMWERWCTKLSYRISKAERPNVDLSAKDISQVQESDGMWCAMKTKPAEKLDKGFAYFKKRRTPSDSLIEMAMSGKTGCKVGATIFWIVVLAGVAYLIYRLVS